MDSLPTWIRRPLGMARRALLGGRALFIVARLRAQNAVTRSSVTGDANVIVSLTTYGPRFDLVYLTIESISRGSVRPRRLILWLDDPQLVRGAGPQLGRLVERGLEIRSIEDYGPHKKYVGALDIVLNSDYERLVTADDDALYPRRWLAGMMGAIVESPGDIVCYRARVVQIDTDGFEPWSTWPLCRGTRPSLLNLAIGDAGVSYPRSVLAHLRERGTRFREVAPRADDLWLHATAVRCGVRTRQVRARPLWPVMTPGSQRFRLSAANVVGGGNDEQLRATYSSDDKAALVEAVGR